MQHLRNITRPTRAKYAWQAVYEKFSKDPQWKNTQSMKDQFMCHYHWAQHKGWGTEPWNLEPHRPEGANIWNKCNP